MRHQVIEIPPIMPLVMEHRLHRLVCPCCSTSTCAMLPTDVEASRYSPRPSALLRLLGVDISHEAIATIRERLSSALTEPTAEALAFARQQPVAYVVDEVLREAVGNNPTGKRGWQWVMVTPVVTVFRQGLSRSTAAAIKLLGSAFGGIVGSDRFSAYNHLPLEQRQLPGVN